MIQCPLLFICCNNGPERLDLAGLRHRWHAGSQLWFVCGCRSLARSKTEPHLLRGGTRYPAETESEVKHERTRSKLKKLFHGQLFYQILKLQNTKDSSANSNRINTSVIRHYFSLRTSSSIDFRPVWLSDFNGLNHHSISSVSAKLCRMFYHCKFQL